MNIGTAKPSAEELKGVPHYFIDSHSIETEVSAATFAREAEKLIDSLDQEYIIVTGGSGMFIDALTNGLDDIPHNDQIRSELNNLLSEKGLDFLLEELEVKDPEYAQTVDRSNPVRVIRALTAIRLTGKKMSDLRLGNLQSKYRVLRFIIDLPREELYERINQRMDIMIENGLIEEIKSLFGKNNKIVMNTVGYKEFIPYLNNEISLDDAIETAKMNSRRYAKRQLTWFRRYKDAIWLKRDNNKLMISNILDKIKPSSEQLE